MSLRTQFSRLVDDIKRTRQTLEDQSPNSKTNLGYLVVFDARKRDFSKGLKELQVVGKKTIYSIAVDLRTNVK